jgi:hypothetical protein
MADNTRLPVGSECQCMAEGCGLFFTGEAPFVKHWTKKGHVHPSEVGLVGHERSQGITWGSPGPGRKPPGRAGSPPRTGEASPNTAPDALSEP